MSGDRRSLERMASGISGAEAYWAIDAAEAISGLPSGVQHMGPETRRADAGRPRRVWPPERGRRSALWLPRLPADAQVEAENLLWWP